MSRRHRDEKCHPPVLRVITRREMSFEAVKRGHADGVPEPPGSADHEEGCMYIGVGTVVLILVIALIVLMLRRR